MSGLTISVVLAVLSVLVAIVTQLCAAGTIRRNPIVGIRVRSTMSGDRAWTSGHTAAIGPVWVMVGALIVVAVVAWFAPATSDAVWPVVSIVLLFAGMAWSISAANRAVSGLEARQKSSSGS